LIDELIESFDIDSVGKGGAKFDFEKLIGLIERILSGVN
jgi:hypothetical protein